MILILGFGFMFVFTAFQTMCNIEVSRFFALFRLSSPPTALSLFVCMRGRWCCCWHPCHWTFVLVLANRHRSALATPPTQKPTTPRVTGCYNIAAIHSRNCSLVNYPLICGGVKWRGVAYYYDLMYCSKGHQSFGGHCSLCKCGAHLRGPQLIRNSYSSSVIEQLSFIMQTELEMLTPIGE